MAYIQLVPAKWVINIPTGISIDKKGKNTQQNAAPIRAIVALNLLEVYY
jgi:hypothetical protein